MLDFDINHRGNLKNFSTNFNGSSQISDAGTCLMKLKVSTWLAMCVAQVKTSAWLFPCSYQFGMQLSSHTSSPDMCSSPSLSESDVLKSEQFCFWNADSCNCHSAEWNIFALNFIQFFHEIIPKTFRRHSDYVQSYATCMWPVYYFLQQMWRQRNKPWDYVILIILLKNWNAVMNG